MTESKIGGMLLAAGGSTRFGSPKQLAKFQGKGLLRRAAGAIGGSGCSPVVVVLGACIEDCRKEIEGLALDVAVNDRWQTGMASSIKTGLAKLLELEPDLDAVLITLMDQPLVGSWQIDLLINTFLDLKDPIVAAEYNDVTGVPALFSREMFEGLLGLTGDKGARQLIRTHAAQTRTVKMDEAAYDIDTPSDADQPARS